MLRTKSSVGIPDCPQKVLKLGEISSFIFFFNSFLRLLNLRSFSPRGKKFFTKCPVAPHQSRNWVPSRCASAGERAPKELMRLLQPSASGACSSLHHQTAVLLQTFQEIGSKSAVSNPSPSVTQSSPWLNAARLELARLSPLGMYIKWVCSFLWG